MTQNNQIDRFDCLVDSMANGQAPSAGNRASSFSGGRVWANVMLCGLFSKSDADTHIEYNWGGLGGC
jgi:hypothetical protein